MSFWTPPYSIFHPRKFYVSYDQDAGQPMTCHAVVEAPDLSYAREHWIELIRALNYCCNPMGSPPYEYNQLFEVPGWMSNDSILEVYG